MSILSFNHIYFRMHVRLNSIYPEKRREIINSMMDNYLQSNMFSINMDDSVDDDDFCKSQEETIDNYWDIKGNVKEERIE